MADMPGFGRMDVSDRGGPHDFSYEDARSVPASPGLTPSHTVGPFFAYGLTPGPYAYPLHEIHRTDLASAAVPGMRLMIEGQVFDGTGAPVHDAMVELLQADSSGIYAAAPRNDGFTGYGRCGTGAEGRGGDTHFRFRTIKPGVTLPGAAPFLTLIVTMRGLLNHCITRMYFPGDDVSRDPVLSQVPRHRRHTLLAKEAAPDRYRFDIHMQGENETVFFDI
jgi:protocatechuate 3,4-dioxygenase alpha subunit